MKGLTFIGTSYDDLCTFPDIARQRAGYQLHIVQNGLDPDNWKPMQTIGSGVREIRIQHQGAYRVIYVANINDSIYVLHAFEKKTQKTSKQDIALAKERFKLLRGKSK